MSTSKTKVFEKFNLLVTDVSMFGKLSDEELTELLDIIISKPISDLRIKDIDLTNVEKADFFSQSFIAEDNQLEFIISQYPNNPNMDAIELICKVNDSDVEYVFDNSTLTFKLSLPTTKDDAVICGYNFYGQFNEMLTDDIMWILAYGMALIWLDRTILKEQLLKNRLTPKDYNQHSPGNLIKELSDLRKQYKTEYEQLKVQYSFGNEFQGFI